MRREKDLTQEYIVFELGISQKAYLDIENGKTKIN
ncbi:MAG: helix-turn-helix transcriptional regulator [Flavobacteriaceae bacterium]|nr:helix-turn-helix transcriptional regulator [Flavobacteriaceae bacterium]